MRHPPRRGRRSDAGDSVAGVFGLLPGHELVSGTIDGIGNAVAVIFNAIGWTASPEALAAAGPVILGALIPIVAVFLVYSRGVTSWMAPAAPERTQTRRAGFGPPGGPSGTPPA